MAKPKPMDPVRPAAAHIAWPISSVYALVSSSAVTGHRARSRVASACQWSRAASSSPTNSMMVSTRSSSFGSGSRSIAARRSSRRSRIRQTHTYEEGPYGARVKLNYGAVIAINDLAFATGRPAFDILDEMAAMSEAVDP